MTNPELTSLELGRKKKKKPKLELKEGFKPFPVELLDQTDNEKKSEAANLNALAQVEIKEEDENDRAKKQPAMLQQAFGKRGKTIEKKSQAVVKEVAKAEGLNLDNNMVQTAALGLVPILLGGLLGGTDGALAGVAAGAKGIETLERGKIAAEERKAGANKLEKEQEQKDREITVKETQAETEKLNQSKKGDLIKSQTALAEAKIKALNLPKPPKPLTEGQSKARIFGVRTRQAGQVFDNLEAQGVDFSDLLGTQSLPNIAQTTEAQQFNQAKLNFLTAVLRKESGAKISDDEVSNGDLQYFPQVGDLPEVLANKKENRRVVTEQLLEEGQVNVNELQAAEDREELKRLRNKFKR